MLTSVIISTILGVIFLLTALLYKKKNNIRIILGIIGVVLMFYGGFAYGSLRPVADIETFDVGNKLQVEYPVKKVKVISPVDGDTVKCRVLSMGVYPKKHDKDIWVLLKPSDDKYYPQSDYTNTSYKEDGRWQVVTRFGGNVDETYDLLVYETDSLASQFFTKTIADWKAANDYSGLEKEELPSGAKRVDQIQLTLENDCRGIF